MSRRKKRKPIGRYRKPSYGAGLRLAQIVLGLQDRPLGWSLEGLAEEIQIHPKTVQRYVKALTEGLAGPGGEPQVVLEEKWGKKFLRVAGGEDGRHGTASSQIAALYAAVLLLRFVRGSALHRPLEEALGRTLGALRSSERKMLTSLQSKIHYVADAPKDYSARAGLVDRVLHALFHQRKLRLSYRSLSAADGPWSGLYHPYTIMLYKRGLYLIGHSERHSEVRTLAVERIADAQVEDSAFNVPRDYAPGQYTEGCFGIVTGDPVDVVIRFKKWVEPLVAGRTWHPSQRVERTRHGDVRLTMRVRGIQELLPWAVSFGPAALVEKPESLRQMVVNWTQEMRKQYRQGKWLRSEGGFDGGTEKNHRP